MGIAVIALLLVLICVVPLREVAQKRKAQENVFRSFATLWDNKHARILFIVNFIEKTGYSTIGILTLYVADYVLDVPNEAQSRAVILTIMGLYCLFPGVAHMIGAWLFWSKFHFDQTDHDRVREALELRRRQDAFHS